MTATTVTTYWKGYPDGVAHILMRYPENRTVCRKDAIGGARFTASDLPSGDRHFRVCRKCRPTR